MGILEKSLTIKRVPTVLSNYQEEDGGAGENFGCGRNCLGKCCLLVSKLPLYTYKNEDEDMIENDTTYSVDQTPGISFLYDLLLGQWEDRMRRGFFRYDVTQCETKIIPGRYGFIAQLNEGRHLKKRPTEFRVDQVLQPFDDNKFNFTKVGQEEALFRFEPSNDMTCYHPSALISLESESPNIVAINVSPIEYGHVLLIPRIFDCLPQRIDHTSFLAALHFAKEAANPLFRVGYNSLGAFATINHLHFQAYYLQAPFPVEKAPTEAISKINDIIKTGIVISQLLEYPVRGFVFEGGKTLKHLSDAVASACIRLQNTNFPFNVLISGCGKKVFLFPQCYAEKQALGQVSQEVLNTQVNPAVWEISGHMVLKRREDFEKASEEYAWKLLSEVSLSNDRFEEIKAVVLEASGLQENNPDRTSVQGTKVKEKSSLEPCDSTRLLLRDGIVLQ
ncbi:GDP-L-galactose phosphorylase 2-like [Amaranthus tricolor]|uniref:GDP-L-galactose phosphorylase 2-like n=1 Tax=Amaranthus tricolor TaxID=29722 RepID=UPI0025847E42|nr:GDP-L-galactose phosphorylase 2-like [Amaranthus tricolor]